MSRSVWKEELILDIYEYARQGFKGLQIASALGISLNTWKLWKKTRPIVKYCMKKAKRKFQDGGTGGETSSSETFMEYCYKRLPKNLQDVFDDLSAVDRCSNPVRKLEKIIENQGKTSRQILWVHALVCTNFNASEACRKTGIARTTYEAWMREDRNFQQLIASMQQCKKDFVEGSLMQQIAAGDVAATIFASRTLNKDRGYDNKIQIEHSGTITHNMVDLNKLELPVDIRLEVFKAIEKQQSQSAIKSLGPRIVDVAEAVIEDEDADAIVVATKKEKN